MNNIKISKEELIEEINLQLTALELLGEGQNQFEIEQALALFDLQFRLKCKLYELTNEQEGKQWEFYRK